MLCYLVVLRSADYTRRCSRRVRRPSSLQNAGCSRIITGCSVLARDVWGTRRFYLL